MPHSLTPTTDTPARTLNELLEALRDNFTVFDFDPERGDQHIDQMVAQWQRMLDGYKRWKEPPPQAAEIESQMQKFSALRGSAAFVLLGDSDTDDDLTVSFNLIPGEEILIGYANQDHQDRATPVSLRVASVLCYDAKLV